MISSNQLDLLVDHDDLPLYTRVYDALRENELDGTVLNIGFLPGSGWIVRFSHASSRQILKFCAYVEADMPEEVSELPNENGDPDVEIPGQYEEHDFEGSASHVAGVPESPDDEEEDEEENSDTPEGQEIRRKIKVVNRQIAARKAAQTVTPTGDKNVSVVTT